MIGRMGAGRPAGVRALAVVVAGAVLAAPAAQAPAAPGGKRKSAGGRHDAGKPACAKGARGRTCRKRRRAVVKPLRPAADVAVPGRPGADVAVPGRPGADVAVPGPVDAAECVAADVGAEAAPVDLVAAATLCLVNVVRHEAGLAALRPHRRLAAAAGGHAEDMVARGFFGHDTPDGVSGLKRARAAGYGATQYSEVIAQGAAPAGTPRGVVAAWLASPAHQAVLLSPLYRDAGMAVASGTPFGGPGGTFVLDLGHD